ncbi:diacylglycerol/lipid kinase family protein [Secundilactobacillus silagei]|uniref:Diacylglycerol kinase family protein n=1 Tax=Secundilactobacillus silagei JCM 19001 TaxID=1302250 RepID=A0A1Z5IJK8_9LACO|nr:YegS/Rv2252/BmrU family lipid kinase [Secundilactobacillus silagei]TDG68682.1 hypothetical protein C5L25_001758 [Secundilactobacillus silagei JCM 19001]GAX01869.1 diacylglycerol kinase family protein [Secundilactobacillus silagei JCM 19001]
MSVSYYIILNEFAGGGSVKKLWPEIKAVLDERHVDYEVAQSTYSGHAQLLSNQFAKAHADDTPTKQPRFVVLTIGGDGTLHQALTGLVEANLEHPIPVASLPVGSGNDFARGIKMAKNWHAALDQILNCTAENWLTIGSYFDTNKQAQGVFTNNVGIGFDAAVVTSANSAPSKGILNRLHAGTLSYLAAIIGVFYNQEAFPLTVHIGQHRDIYPHAYLVTVTNHPYFGGGVKIAPSASVSDPNLDLIVIEKANIFKLLFISLMLSMGKHLKLKSVHHYHENKLHLIVPSIEYGQIDGEDMGGRYWDTYFETKQYPFWIDPTI